MKESLESMRMEIAAIALELPEQRAKALSHWRKFWFKVDERALRHFSKASDKSGEK